MRISNERTFHQNEIQAQREQWIRGHAPLQNYIFTCPESLEEFSKLNYLGRLFVHQSYPELYQALLEQEQNK